MSDDEWAGRTLLELHRAKRSLCRARSKLKTIADDLNDAGCMISSALDQPSFGGLLSSKPIASQQEIDELSETISAAEQQVDQLEREAQSIE